MYFLKILMQPCDLGENETRLPFEFCFSFLFHKETYEKAQKFYLKAKKGETLDTDEDHGIMKRKRK